MSAFGLNQHTRAFAYAIKAAGGSRLIDKNLMVVELLVNELWGWAGTFESLNTVFRFLYPFIGGNAIAHSFNLVDPTGTRITWAGTVTHDANGITGNGTTGEGDTGRALGGGSSVAMSWLAAGVYSRTNSQVAGYDLSNGGPFSTSLALRWTTLSGATPTYVGITAVAEAASGNTGLTLNAPSSPQIDDIWVACLSQFSAGPTAFADWNALTVGSQASLYWFRYRGTMPNLTATWASSQNSPSGAIVVVRGCKKIGSPINLSGTQSGTSSTGQLPSITPTLNNTLLVGVLGVAGVTTLSGATSGFTTIFEDSNGLGTNKSSMGIYYIANASGASPNLQQTIDAGSSTYAGRVAAFLPPQSETGWFTSGGSATSPSVVDDAGVTDSRGLFCSLRTSSSNLKAYRNGAQVGGTDAVVITSAENTGTFKLLSFPVTNERSSRNLAFAFATVSGQSYNSKQAELYTIIQNFQIRLGRQV